MAQQNSTPQSHEASQSTGSSMDSTRNLGGLALTTAALFLAVVAVLIGAPALFYMGTAMFVLIGASQMQAYLSVRGLRFERVVPESAKIGDLVTVEITVWSLKKLRRPLITVVDNLPSRLLVNNLTASLPIAPAFDLPIRTQYQLRPQRRGRFRWSGLTVEGTDALGLVTKRRIYRTESAEMTVLPRAIPVSIEVPNASGWGISEMESGRNKGAGLEPRGIRGYAPGDSLRFVHWRSSAKTGQLLVKEFEAGAQAGASFLLQRTSGSDIGPKAHSSLDQMVGHAVFIAESFLRQGARVEFPGLEERRGYVNQNAREAEVHEILAGVEAGNNEDVSQEVLGAIENMPPGSILFVMVTVQDPGLPQAVMHAHGRGTRVVVLAYDADHYWEAANPPAALSIRGLLAGLAGKSSRVRHNHMPSATDPVYMESLRRSGAHCIVMPSEVSFED